MRIALGQINSLTGNLQANYDKHVEFIKKAIEVKADLIVFPELSLTGVKVGQDVDDISLSPESDEIKQIGELSHSIDIVVGLAERSRSSLYNRYNTVFYFSDRKLLHRHRKLFLVNYAVFEEAKHYVPGNNLQAFDTPLGRMAMLICNDVWHAPSAYLAALDGAEIMITPTNSAQGTLEDQLNIQTSWEHMNRANSAMMGFYTVFVNRVGIRSDKYGEFPYWGGSEIIDPQGNVIVKAPYDEEAFEFADIDITRVSKQRYNAPIIRDARLWLFQQEINRLAIKRSEAVRLPEGMPPAEPSQEDFDMRESVSD